MLQREVIVKMEINIILPADFGGRVNFDQLERDLERKLSNNPEDDVCVCETSDERAVNNIKDYFLSSYTFGVGIFPVKEDDFRINYKIKFKADI